MNTRICLSSSLLALCLMVVMIWSPGHSLAFQTAPGAGAPMYPPVQPREPQPGAASDYGSGYYTADPRSAVLERLMELNNSLRDAGDDDRERIISEIETALGEHFDLDLEHRRSELARLTDRADGIEALNERRAMSRSEIIDLQFEAFLHEADGIDVLSPTQGSTPGRQGYSPFGMRTLGLPEPVPYHSDYSVVDVQYDESGSFGGGTASPYSGNSPASNVSAPPSRDGIILARQALAEAADSDAEDAAKAELRTALEEYFDQDMEYRQSELGNIREELESLEAKINERVDAKDEIVSLQLKIIVNEADGLGFFSGNHVGGAWPTYPAVEPAGTP